MARVEHVLLPWSSFVILPMFALANAGVRLSWIALDGALTNAIGIGIVLGLVIGKPLGILIGSFAATRAGGRLPDDVAWGNVAGMAITAGIGFTVALFIAELAFVGPLLEHAKIAILVGSIAAGVLGSITLRIAGSGRSSRTE
jgi:NhaA family Na+:H+ antiporter